jgi:predicted nucleic acid-binding protein
VKYFLDSNVFMYAAGREHPLKAPCLAILRRVAADEIEALTNTEVLQEILYRHTAIGERDRGLRLARLAVDQVGGEILPVTLEDMRHAFDLVERYGAAINSRDAVHAATMLTRSLTHVISADRHLDMIEGITRVDPQEAARLKA